MGAYGGDNCTRKKYMPSTQRLTLLIQRCVFRKSGDGAKRICLGGVVFNRAERQAGAVSQEIQD